MFGKEVKPNFDYYLKGLDEYRFRDFHAKMHWRTSKVLNQEDTDREEKVLAIDAFDYVTQGKKTDIFVRKALLSATFALARKHSKNDLIEIDTSIRIGRGENSPRCLLDQILHDPDFQAKENFSVPFRNSRLVRSDWEYLPGDRMFYLLKLGPSIPNRETNPRKWTTSLQNVFSAVRDTSPFLEHLSNGWLTQFNNSQTNRVQEIPTSEPPRR